MLPIVNELQLGSLLLHPAAAHSGSQVLNFRQRYRLNVPHLDGYVRYGFGKHLSQLRSHAEDQRRQKDDDDDTGGNSAHCEQGLAAASRQMAHGKLCLESPPGRNKRESAHSPCLLTRTVCPAVIPAGFTITWSVSVTPLEIGIPSATAGRVSTGFSTMRPSSTISTTERLP